MKGLFPRVLVFGLVVSLLAGCALNANSPRPSESQQERRASENPNKELGKAFLKEALRHYQFVKDPEVTGLVNRVGGEIARQIGSSPEGYHFFVVREDQPNAFAIPGGYVFVFDGLLAQMKTVDELAGVLAHEIAHVERNHFFKDEKKLAALDIATLAAILLGGGNMAPVIIAGAANADVRLQFSRENESEADTFALQYLRKSGFDPLGLAAFFQTLIEYERFNPQLVPAYMATHPDVKHRKTRLEGLVRTLPADSREDRAPDLGREWERVATILLAHKNTAKKDSDFVENLPLDRRGELSPEERKEREHYLRGLTYLKANRPTEAVPEYLKALETPRPRPVYYTDLALAHLKQQKVAEARRYAERSLDLDPDFPQAHTILGQVEENSGNADGAIAHFQKALRGDPSDPSNPLYLSLAYGKKGDAAKASFYSARYLRLNLQPLEARREFERARKLTGEEDPLYPQILREIAELERNGI
jgi:predicted Zn-dependent protease